MESNHRFLHVKEIYSHYIMGPFVAGGGFEPPQAFLGSLGYEPSELPLLHPAICTEGGIRTHTPFRTLVSKTSTSNRSITSAYCTPTQTRTENVSYVFHGFLDRKLYQFAHKGMFGLLFIRQYRPTVLIPNCCKGRTRTYNWVCDPLPLREMRIPIPPHCKDTCTSYPFVAEAGLEPARAFLPTGF